LLGGEIMNPIQYTKTAFKADPCKKCIIRACCSKYCEEKRHWKIHDDNGIWYDRFMVISLWFSSIIVIISIIL
jgi:sulfatase maturation enzyme AslB (radical SAM superfamily)